MEKIYTFKNPYGKQQDCLGMSEENAKAKLYYNTPDDGASSELVKVREEHSYDDLIEKYGISDQHPQPMFELTGFDLEMVEFTNYRHVWTVSKIDQIAWIKNGRDPNPDAMGYIITTRKWLREERYVYG